MTSSEAQTKNSSVNTTHGCILYIEGLTVSFDGFKALNDLNLYIDEGEPVSYTHLTLPTICSV